MAQAGVAAHLVGLTAAEIENEAESLTLQFCEDTNESTNMALARALQITREEISSYASDPSIGIDQLTKRVNQIFDHAEGYRARMIAHTESSRAIHTGERGQAVASGVVKGGKPNSHR